MVVPVKNSKNLNGIFKYDYIELNVAKDYHPQVCPLLTFYSCNAALRLHCHIIN